MLQQIQNYIRSFPAETQEILTKIHSIIKEEAPEATEGFTYGMPSFKTHGRPLVYFAAFKNHIGLYATPSAHTEFAKEFTVYKHGKGSVQFPLDKPIPYDLIRLIVAFRVYENNERAKK